MKINKPIKTILIDTAVEIVGCFLASVAICNFAVPAGFPMSGFSGIAIIINRLTNIHIGLATVIMNIPVAILCYKLIGKGFFTRSLRCMIIFSLMIDYLAPLLPLYEGSVIISALCTGILGGLGYAIIYLRGSSTGGSDFIVMAIKTKNQHIKLGNILFVNDSLIIIAGGIIFKDFDGIVYGLIINYIYAIMTDRIMYGLNSGKLAVIVTDFGREVTAKIDENCDRGTTIIKGTGGYSNTDHDVVLCACATKEMVNVEKAVKEADPAAFTIILDSNEVLGEGFAPIKIAERES